MKLKRILALALCMLVVLSGCAKKGAKKDSETEIPENGVVYEYSDGGNSDRIVSRTTYENSKAVRVDYYDYWPSGEIKTVTTKQDGVVTDTWDYLYSEGGVLTQMVRSFNDGDYACKEDYRYNENGTMSEAAYYVDEDYMGGVRYTYNRDNLNPALEENLDPNGDVYSYTEYTFNVKGDTQSAKYFMYGSLDNYCNYEYDEKERLLSISYYDSKDNLTKKSEYVYSPDGSIQRVNDLDSEGNITGYRECLYDDKGFNYRDIFYENGKPVYRCDYNENGIPVYSKY